MTNKPWMGRIGPLRYFLGVLTFALVPYILGTAIFSLIPDSNSVPILLRFVLLIPVILFIGACFFILCLAIRRCHDLGWSGWLSIVPFIPVIGWIFVLVLLFKGGSPEVNKYGHPP